MTALPLILLVAISLVSYFSNANDFPANLIKRYMDNVPLIVPLLEKEYRSATRKLHDVNQEIRYVKVFSYE